MQLFDTIGTVIENNWIGTTTDGMAPGHLSTIAGVWFDGENRDALIVNNRIAGVEGEGRGPHYAGWHFGSAIRFGGTGEGARILGNTIGLNALGEPVLGSVTGVSVDNYYIGPMRGVVLGGPGAGEGNEIAGHRTAGVSIGNMVTDARIRGNSIHDNATLGIDLIDSMFRVGVSPNDPLDADTGGNGLQNFPVLRAARATGGGVWIAGDLDSVPTSSYTLDFFASPTADPSGHGEGQRYLGSLAVTTNAAGHAGFAGLLRVRVDAGWVVCATATREPIGATSEFGPALAIRPPDPRLAR